MNEINYKEELDKIKERLKEALKTLEKVENETVSKKIKFEKIQLDNIIKNIEKKKATEKFYNAVVERYKQNVKDNLKATIDAESEGELKETLNEIYKELPEIENKFYISSDSEPEQPRPEPEPEQTEPIQGISPMLTKGPLPERITPNPDAPPITEGSTTPTLDDDFIKPKQDPEEEEEEPDQPEQPEPDKSLLPADNKQIIEQKGNGILAERYIKELEDNPDLDIIKGVGDVIEFIATNTLTDDMIEGLIDQMLGLKDSHGNLLFRNRFQIEDLIRNRKKRKRLKYLLPKQIIRAEKPDEQKLILNPMLKRGRLASMTSAKTKYYNYI